MKVTLDTSLDQNYRWVISHYDSVISSVNEQVLKAYINALVSTGGGIAIWFILRLFIDNHFIQSFEFLAVLALTASGVFLFYGRRWASDIKSRHLQKRFTPKAVEYIARVKTHLISDYAKNTANEIEKGKEVFMDDIIAFVQNEKSALGIPDNKRINHVDPSEEFLNT